MVQTFTALILILRDADSARLSVTVGVKLRFNLENDRRKLSGVEIRIEWIYVRGTELEV